jgi:hypothetical protein
VVGSCRQPCRTPCARARCTGSGTVLAQLISDTLGPSWAPLLRCGLVRRHRSPHNRMPRVPLALPVYFPLPPTSRPQLFHEARPGSSHGSTAWSRALSHTQWSASRPDGPAAGRHAFAHCHGLRVTTGSLPPLSLESASVSVAAVTFDRRLCRRWVHLTRIAC